MTSPVHGRLRTTLIVGAIATVSAGMAASVASAATRTDRAVVRRDRSVSRGRLTVLTVSASPTPASRAGRHVAADDAPRQSSPIGSTSPTGCVDTRLVPNASDAAAVGAATLCLINRLRLAAGVPALVESSQLDRSALAHTLAMVAENYFGHVGPDGLGVGQRVRATGYVPRGRGGLTGENVAAGSGSMATAAATVTDWMASPPHRANILNPLFTATGIGVTGAVPRLVGHRSGGTYTEDFA